MKQFCVTPSMGKRLIGKAMAARPDIQEVLRHGTLVIVAGTTNGYVAEEILAAVGQAQGFQRQGFRRGMTVAPGAKVPKADFPGDVVIRDGDWLRGQTIFDVADDLKAGDIVMKGANAVDRRGHAAVHIGDPKGGTILAAMATVFGRRVRLIVPVGLEKRVLEDVHVLARRTLDLDAAGPRLLPILGEVFTELDAIASLTGAQAYLLAAGGIYGAEGASWLGITGTGVQVGTAAELIRSVAGEPPCRA
jgi:hypothetical protein